MEDATEQTALIEDVLRSVTGRKLSVIKGHDHAVGYALSSHVLELFHRRGLGTAYDGIPGLHRFVVEEERDLSEEEHWAVLHVVRMCEEKGFVSEPNGKRA